MPERTVEDRLREEYFDLLPQLGKVCEQLEAEVRYHCLPISCALAKHERMVVRSRVKSCDSAVDALRRREPFGQFYREKPEAYSLLKLKDLIGVRILAFPRSRLSEIDRVLRGAFPEWKEDPVLEAGGALLSHKYYGPSSLDSAIQCEYQVASMLTGLFWDVEHSAIYKPAPELKGIMEELSMKEATQKVYEALRSFEDEFERLLLQGDA